MLIALELYICYLIKRRVVRHPPPQQKIKILFMKTKGIGKSVHVHEIPEKLYKVQLHKMSNGKYICEGINKANPENFSTPINV